MFGNHEFEMQALRYRFIYSMAGLVLGLLCMIGGAALIFFGITGAISWTTKILGSESTVANAGPGVILFIIGLFVTIATRYKVKVTRVPTPYGMGDEVHLEAGPVRGRADSLEFDEAPDRDGDIPEDDSSK